MVIAPELTERAQFLAADASKRSAAEAGIPNVMTGRHADDLLLAAEPPHERELMGIQQAGNDQGQKRGRSTAATSSQTPK